MKFGTAFPEFAAKWCKCFPPLSSQKLLCNIVYACLWTSRWNWDEMAKAFV